MKITNLKLKKALGRMYSPEVHKELVNLPAPDTYNLEGSLAYKLPEALELLTMLNTLKMEPQYYQNTTDQILRLQELIAKLAMADPYFVAQCIVYSRCLRTEGLRTVNHIAAALLAPFLRGEEWGKRFYSLWDKKARRGGCIFRTDDMIEIKRAYKELNGGGILANSMKKGFKSALERMDAYQILKYKKASIDLANLVHPNISVCKGKIDVNGVPMVAIDALMRGLNVSAETWEVAQSEAGQLVAAAQKDGVITKEEAEEMLDAAKAENWMELLRDKKLPYLAALRNIRNILEVCEDVSALCALLSDEDRIVQGKIMPYQIDMAYEVVLNDCPGSRNKLEVLAALERGYVASVPNLASLCTGRNLVILDCSASMYVGVRDQHTGRESNNSCLQKASLIAATIVQATGADCIRFGRTAEYADRMNGRNLFEYSQYLRGADMGGTNLASAFELITRLGKEYDRIFILSDYQCNVGKQALAYAEYIRRVNSPYIYSIDMAAYGTAPLKNQEKVFYYYGYGFSMFTDISRKEFRPEDYISEVRKIVI